MKTISLSKGFVALIDDEDYEFLTIWSWCVAFWRNRPVAVNSHGRYMHRLLFPFSEEVDHIDHDGLNNQKYNLRAATRQQNSFNVLKRANTSSRFKGVCWCKRTRRWHAQICLSGKAHFLGRYNSENTAALVYNEAAQKYFGEFALLNDVEP